MKKERDTYIVDRYENELKNLYSQLNETDRKAFSIDELLQNLKEYRRMNHLTKKYY